MSFVSTGAFPGQQRIFSDIDVQKVQAYWAQPGRYEVGLPKDWIVNGLWQVRLTVAGSQWLWNYNRALGQGKFGELQESAPAIPSEDRRAWENWISAKVDWDRMLALGKASKLNSTLNPSYSWPVGIEASDPGAAPKALVKLASNPPIFAEAVVPLQHTIRFPDGKEILYQDNPRMAPRYMYYRNGDGVMSAGTKVRTIPKEKLSALFRSAGISDSARNVMEEVSLLEGGFDSVNTYDTGFVSVGMIQFASLKEGGGSLGRLMKRFKQASPQEFNRLFHQYGIEVSELGKLIVLDLATWAELSGPDANSKIMEDKRLIAVFQHAGQVCEAFQREQIRSTYADYHPGSDVIEFSLGGTAVRMAVHSFIKSEAGMATLMDRKVNTGTLEPLPFVLATLAVEKGITASPSSHSNEGEIGERVASAFVSLERDIITRMKFRKDFLVNKSLTQPK